MCPVSCAYFTLYRNAAVTHHIILSYLLKFVGNHSKSLEDGVCWSSDGDNPLWTVALRDIDPCSALEKQHKRIVSRVKADVTP